MRSLGLVLILALLAWLAYWLLGTGAENDGAGALGPGEGATRVVVDSGELSAPERDRADGDARRSAEPFAPQETVVEAGASEEEEVAPLSPSFLVVDLANGLPIADARMGFEEEALATTDGEGRADIELSLLERRERLHVQATGYARALVLLDHGSNDRDLEYRIELSRSASLQGKVLGLDPGASHEVVVTTSWRNLVQPFLSHETGYGNHEWSALVGADGSFALDDLAPFVPLLARLDTDGENAEMLQLEPLELQAGELRRITWDLSDDCAVIGRVVDANGEAVEGVRVEARTGINSFAQDQSFGQPFSGSETDADGRFHLAGLRADEYLIGLGVQADGEDSEQLAVEPAFVRLAGGVEETVTLVAHPAAYLAGKVLNAKGKPLRGATVFAVRGSVLVRLAQSDDEGRFRVGPLRSGEHDLWVNAMHESRDASPPSLQVEAPAENIVIQLLEAASLRGKIVDPVTGEVLPGNASLQAVDGDGVFWSDPSRTPSGLSFAFRSIPPGRFDLIAVATDGRIGIQHNVELEQGQRINTLEVPVGPSGELRIRVALGPDRGLRVSAGTLRLFDFRATGSSQQRMYAPPGPVEVSVMKRGSLTGFNDWVPEETRIVMVVAGGLTEVEFD